MRTARTFVILGLVLVLLGGAFYAVDRYVRGRTETTVATQVQRQAGTPEPPVVEIEDWPFLTQVATGSVGRIHLVGDDLGAVNESPLLIAHADVMLTDVTSNDSFKTMMASHAEGTARVDYDALQSLAGVPLTYVGDGRIQVIMNGAVAGQQMEAKVTGVPMLNARDQTITLGEPKISVAGVQLPDFTAGALLRALYKPIAITGVPFGLRITALRAKDDGIQADVSGDNLPISR